MLTHTCKTFWPHLSWLFQGKQTPLPSFADIHEVFLVYRDCSIHYLHYLHNCKCKSHQYFCCLVHTYSNPYDFAYCLIYCFFFLLIIRTSGFQFIALMGMNPAMLVAVAATIGNLLQGWDNATIAGIFSIFTPLLHFGFLHQLHNVPLLPKHSLSQCLNINL